MSSSAGKHGGNSKNNGKKMAAMMKKAAENNRGKKKKKRPAMSRPAKFFLQAGQFQAPDNQLMPLYLADTYCFIQVPDGTIHELHPEKKASGYKLYDEAPSWTAALGHLNDALEKRVAEKVRVTPKTAPRILLTGSPVVFPNWKIPQLIEETGGALVCDELCTSNRYLGDMVALDEMMTGDILHSLADRYLQPCTCPVFSSTIDRREKLLQMIIDYRIEGVVHHILKGCHPYDAELGVIEKELNNKGVSQLKIETDYNPEDTEQIRTRMEAFIETLKGRRG